MCWLCFTSFRLLFSCLLAAGCWVCVAADSLSKAKGWLFIMHVVGRILIGFYFQFEAIDLLPLIAVNMPPTLTISFFFNLPSIYIAMHMQFSLGKTYAWNLFEFVTWILHATYEAMHIKQVFHFMHACSQNLY